MTRHLRCLTMAGALGLLYSASPLLASDSNTAEFNMMVAAGAKTCLSKATATVRIKPAGPVDVMDVTVEGLPANTDFGLFVIQVPKTPFGVAWYQGDIVTDRNGRGHQEFAGRFNIETFSFAQGTASAPVVFGGAFPDASVNPPFNPIQMYHLGIWFDSFNDAQKAGCAATVTAFNGQHNAGIQVFNTSNFPDDHGPLRNVTDTSSTSDDRHDHN